MKAIGYFVMKREACGACGGTGVVQHSTWAQFWSEGGAEILRDEAAFRAWWHRHGYYADGLPPEEEMCGQCEGRGCTEEQVPLVSVPNFAQICERIEALESRIGMMPAGTS